MSPELVSGTIWVAPYRSSLVQTNGRRRSARASRTSTPEAAAEGIMSAEMGMRDKAQRWRKIIWQIQNSD